MKTLLLSASVLAFQNVSVAAAQEADAPPPPPEREEIVITGHYIEGLDLLAGTSAIEGAELQREMSTQIGETLVKLPGVSATSFSPGASRPVLRGYQGTRIRVLNDGLGSIDVSNTSADHAVTIDPLTAERIEVLRGPAVLLFGSEAIGGAVNVIDHRIPRSRPDGGIHLDYIGRYSSADEGVGVGGALDLALGDDFVFHIDGSHSTSDDLEVGGYVVSEPLRAELFELYEEALDEGELEEAEEALEAANLRDVLPNSKTRQSSAGAGFSYLGDRFEFGASASLFDTRYGVPGRPGAEHHHGEEEEDHGDEDHDEDEHGEEEGEAPVSIDMLQKRLDFRGRVYLDGFLDRIDARFAYADYEHTEFEGAEVGTVFLSDGLEGRIEFHQADRDGWGGVSGAQYYERDLEAIGAEAFVPPHKTSQWGLFTRQEYEPGAFGVEGAIRVEGTEVTSDPLNFSRDFTALSGAVGAHYKVTPDFRIGANMSRTSRAPSGEELLSDGPHIATQAFEIGDPTLENEKAWGGELYARYEGPRAAASLTLWCNKFDGFIYNFDTGVEEDELPVFLYDQQDADWWGIEFEAGATLVERDGFALKADAVVDYVRATLDDSNPVPRIPPFSVNGGLGAEVGDFNLRIEAEYAAEQDRVAEFENPTDDHLLVGASIGWRFRGRDNESLILLSADNIFDVDARRHASYTKDFVPLAGRNIKLSTRFSF
ncbi:TonB-dependent receptor [Sphingomicrobium clamense]|uniref:TonB-dependent receptor n=1 Tax=Sphingomicrobium clamense TaxID=2851013 RepID=A0ABS6V7U4_9SPHN|nr:TonB-dependent receptor [Sphingomicrobium sp. B8]MBW0145648.1 TonB-dependent receptor [Sphingomicrobium sp. B8]